ncbi:hypothetical protein QTP88_000944 [Uroleucon formosanum]
MAFSAPPLIRELSPLELINFKFTLSASNTKKKSNYYCDKIASIITNNFRINIPDQKPKTVVTRSNQFGPSSRAPSADRFWDEPAETMNLLF